MKPISYYYSSKSYPLPQAVQEWLESLPTDKKIEIASALLNQATGPNA